MKKVFKVITTLFFTFAIVALMLPGTVSAASSPASIIPTSINGLPVIFVQTPENTPALTTQENASPSTAVKRIITLLDTSSSSMQESASKFSSDIESVRAMLRPGDVIEIYGGNGATEAQFDSAHAANNASWSEHSSVQSYLPAANNTHEKNTSSSDTGTQNPGWAYFQDNDTNILGLSAHISGINNSSWGNCGFLVNGLTNGQDQNSVNYFLQSGQWLFGPGITSWNCWATSVGGQNNDPQGPYGAVQFNLPYVVGHDYEYDVIYLGGGNSGSFNGQYSAWWLGTEDHSAGGTFDYVIEYYGYGTGLVNSNPNTSVFFENWNASANWNPGAVYVSASEAREYTSSYQWVNWTSATPDLGIGGIYPFSPIGVICGTIAQNQTASWYLPSVPTYQ